MSDTPRTDALQEEINNNDNRGNPEDICTACDFARGLEREATWLRCDRDALRKELAALTIEFQSVCDHEFVTEDHSFSHDRGTERIIVCRCEKCGLDKEPDSESDEEPPERERDE